MCVRESQREKCVLETETEIEVCVRERQKAKCVGEVDREVC